MMTSKIETRHLERPAYVYLRQSTMGQVRHHRESTERQYALREKAISLGWRADIVRVLDGDLGLSGAQSQQREDFKTLVADVSMGKVGAVFSLEASRLSRSNTDWHRLLELCSLTGTLIIDDDGCYDPADFNDQLILGLKGTMSQAELHFIRARLQGGKLNKAKKGELRAPLPVGYVYDAAGRTMMDPDVEVQGAIRLLYDVFRQTGSAYKVVQHFASNTLKFPKRSYGGAWDGKLVMGSLTHARVREMLKNPTYAGTYVYGRHTYKKRIDEAGVIHANIVRRPMDEWTVTIKDHHAAYISWEEYLENQRVLAKNLTKRDDTMLTGPAREGLALLQGLLLCAACGRKIYVRYTGNGGIYPCYQCTWRKRDGLSASHCLSLPAPALDEAISNQVVEILTPSQIDVALKAYEEIERRTTAVDRQWQLKVERLEYEARLAQRRYEEVDPSNRLVASTLEKGWNDALVSLDELRKQHEAHRAKQGLSDISRRRDEILALGQELPRLWRSKSTAPRDRKRILRLLVKDITVERRSKVDKAVVLRIRWHGGATQELTVMMPANTPDKWRHAPEIVERVRVLAMAMTNDEIASLFNQEGLRTNKGNEYTTAGISWIRYKHAIPSPILIRPDELTVEQVAARFNVSAHVVYYWISKQLITARKLKPNAPWWLTIDADTDARLQQWCEASTRIEKSRTTSQTRTVGGAL
jgi:DNA invertase Pin-like site-specific DNA recombinase